jgi:hypothetical protein
MRFAAWVEHDLSNLTEIDPTCLIGLDARLGARRSTLCTSGAHSHHRLALLVAPTQERACQQRERQQDRSAAQHDPPPMAATNLTRTMLDHVLDDARQRAIVE